VAERDIAAFEAQFPGLSCQPVGTVRAELALTIRSGKQVWVNLPVDELVSAWQPDLA
jgi:hypothetical protein